MKITDYRKDNGQYKERPLRKIWRLLKFLFFVGLYVIYIVLLFSFVLLGIKQSAVRTKEASQNSEMIQAPQKSELESIKERESFKKRMDNQAEQIYLQEEIDQRNAQISSLKTEISTIETQLEQARTEELSL